MVSPLLVEIVVGDFLIPLTLAVILPLLANGPIVVVASPPMDLDPPVMSVVSLATWP